MRRSIMGTNVTTTLSNLKVANSDHRSKYDRYSINYYLHSYKSSYVTYKFERKCFHPVTGANKNKHSN